MWGLGPSAETRASNQECRNYLFKIGEKINIPYMSPSPLLPPLPSFTLPLPSPSFLTLSFLLVFSILAFRFDAMDQLAKCVPDFF